MSNELNLSIRRTREIVKSIMPKTFRIKFDERYKEAYQAEVYEFLLKNNYDLIGSARDIGISTKDILKILKQMDKYDEYLRKRAEIDQELLDTIITTFYENKRFILRTACALNISADDLRDIRAKYFSHIPINRNNIYKRESLKLTAETYRDIIDIYEGNFRHIAKFLGVEEERARKYANKICPISYIQYLACEDGV